MSEKEIHKLRAAAQTTDVNQLMLWKQEQVYLEPITVCVPVSWDRSVLPSSQGMAMLLDPEEDAQGGSLCGLS